MLVYYMFTKIPRQKRIKCVQIQLSASFSLLKITQKKHRKQRLIRCVSVLYVFVIPLGLEPKTYCLEGSCSIQLSYGTIKSGAKLILFLGITK